MTNIQPYNDHAPATFEEQLNAQMKHAEVMSQAGMLPEKFKGNPANVLVAQEIARSMGETAWVVMSELYFVSNTPTFSAKYMRSRVRAAGHILREKYDPQTMTATCVIIRHDDPDFEHIVTWDKAKAVAHGLWDKGHWKKNHELMLKNRAVSECTREACNEVMGGVNYTPEEAREMQSVQVTATRTDARGMDQVRAALAQKQQPAPVVDDPLSAALTEIQDTTDRGLLEGIVEKWAGLVTTDEEAAAVAEAGRQRWTELAAEQMDNEHE